MRRLKSKENPQQVIHPLGIVSETSVLGLGLMIVVIPPLRKHLFELLFLRVGHDGFELALAVLHDALRLLAAILLAE